VPGRLRKSKAARDGRGLLDEADDLDDRCENSPVGRAGALDRDQPITDDLQVNVASSKPLDRLTLPLSATSQGRHRP